MQDLRGKRFGRLLAVEPTQERRNNAVVWKCRCDCGKPVEVRGNLLSSGQVCSCGCKKTDQDKNKPLENLTYQDDTCIEFLRNISKPTKKNTTGVRGVTLQKDGKYQVTLNFRKKYYYLGRYDTLEDAAAARKQAEVMVEEYLKRFGGDSAY